MTRNVGAIFPYHMEYTETETDFFEQLFAVEWYRPTATTQGVIEYLEEINSYIEWDICRSPNETGIAVCNVAMEKARNYIVSQLPAAPWKEGCPYLSGGFFCAAQVEYQDNTTMNINPWAFTGNALQFNTSNPCQSFGKIKIPFLPDNVSSVDIEVNGIVYKELKDGDELGWEQLQHCFPWGDLPAPELGFCDSVEGPTLWPIVQNVVNDLYPWGRVGSTRNLTIKIVGYKKRETRNAYLSDLPENMR